MDQSYDLITVSVACFLPISPFSFSVRIGLACVEYYHQDQAEVVCGTQRLSNGWMVGNGRSFVVALIYQLV